MKILDVSSITDSSEMPVKKGTLKFLQDAYAEIVKSVMQSLAGGNDYDPTKVYVLYGVINSGAAPAFNVTAGGAFFNGEVFQVEAAGFTATGSNTAVFKIVQTQYTVDADPVTFTDNAVRQIHNIRTLQIQQGAAGSGVANLVDAIYLNFDIPAQLNLTVTGNATISGTYPNIEIKVSSDAKDTVKMFAGDVSVHFSTSGLGISADWGGWAIANGQNNTKDLRGHVPVQMSNADGNDRGYANPVRNDADFLAIGNQGGEKTHILLETEMPSHGSHFTDSVSGRRPNFESGENVIWPKNQTNSGGGQAHNNMQPYFVLCFVQKIS